MSATGPMTAGGAASRPLPSYLRMARRSRGGWWRLVAALGLGTIGFFVVTLAALLVVEGFARLFGQPFKVDTDHVGAALLLATNLGLALCIPLAGLLARIVYGTRPRWLGSTAPGIRRRWLLSCVGMAATIWGVLFLLLLLAIVVSGEARIDGHAVAILAVVLTTTPLQAAGEEYLFRGFLLQGLGATGLSAPVCWVASGALFATAHGQFDPPLFADRLLIGIVFGWLATSTGGLEASIAIHAVKNVSVFIPAALLHQVSGAVDPSNVTWAPFALDAVMLAAVGAWIRSRTKRRDRRPAITGPPPGWSPPPPGWYPPQPPQPAPGWYPPQPPPSVPPAPPSG